MQISVSIRGLQALRDAFISWMNLNKDLQGTDFPSE